MTENNKRFTLNSVMNFDYGILDDGEEIGSLANICDLLNELNDENHKLKQQLFETSKELLWATSDEVDRSLHYEDEVEELRKEIFE